MDAVLPRTKSWDSPKDEDDDLEAVLVADVVGRVAEAALKNRYPCLLARIRLIVECVRSNKLF